jgi:hypothetical protein
MIDRNQAIKTKQIYVAICFRASYLKNRNVLVIK